MLLFVAPYPDKSNEKDGMMQRIAAIDKIFSSHERIYLQLSYIQNIVPTIERKSDLVRVYRLNLIAHFLYLVYLAKKAKFVYVHSVYQAKTIKFLYYLCNNIITDMHGLVPEEETFKGNIKYSKIFNNVEHIVLNKSKLVVTVTHAMIDHFRNKYGNTQTILCNIPIFNTIPDKRIKLHRPTRKLNVVYAGGTQKWQNVDRMIDAIKSTIDLYNFTILSSDPEYFEQKFKDLGIDDKVTLASVLQDKVYDYYAEADLGFILRNDVIINNVACPTKLVEYLSCGVVPIVIQPNIGDFLKYNYCYVLLEEFLKGVSFSTEELEEMINQNNKVMQFLHQEVEENISELLHLADT